MALQGLEKTNLLLLRGFVYKLQSTSDGFIQDL